VEVVFRPASPKVLKPILKFPKVGAFLHFVNAGFVDTFREFEKGGGHYSWWSPMSGARARNVGWRIDYFLLSQSLRPRLKKAYIQPKVMGSDHCPVGIELV
jgi:exodeoxyribonuclease-3